MYRIGQEEKDAVARVIDGKDFFKINNSYQESMHAEEDLRRIFDVENWTPIIEKRGALHPLMDPFQMEANKDIVPDYTPDMCPKTLDYLARTCYFDIHPDLTEKQVDEMIAKIRAAL